MQNPFTMKKYLLQISAACMALACLAGCRGLMSDGRTSLGRPYELLVICPDQEWDGALGDSLRALLGAQIPRMNTPETYFDINHTTKQRMNDLLNKQRNILTVSFDPLRSQTQMLVEYDYSAKPQIVVSLKASTPESALEYVSENGQALMRVLEMAERDRDLAVFKDLRDEDLSRLFEEHTGLDMTVLQGYFKANTVDDRILWLRKDYNRMSQDIFAFSYPCTDRTDLTAEWLERAIDNRLAKIPGPSAGSYMQISKEVAPIYSTFRIGDRYWFELRGLWDVYGDFMGGPFVSYSTVDMKTAEITTVVFSVYAPQLDKRDYIREMEHQIYTITK